MGSYVVQPKRMLWINKTIYLDAYLYCTYQSAITSAAREYELCIW